MSDKRRFRWRSGRLASTPINDGWAPTLFSRDPEIPNLPIDPPLPTPISGTASLGLAADLWTDGPKVVIAGKSPRIEYTGVYRRPWYQAGAVFTYFTPATVEGGTSAIEGSAALTITGTATLAGVGALATSTPLVFGGTSALTGSGALAGTSALTFGTGTVTLAGTGALTGAAALVLGASGSFDQGAILGSGALTFAESAALTATGTLAASGAIVFGGTSALTGSGALVGADTLTFGGTSALTGAGALAGSGAITFGNDATLVAASGSVTGSADIVFGASATLTPPAVSEERPSGGYLAANMAAAERQRRRKRRRDVEESAPGLLPPGPAQAGPGSADATPPAPAADLELVRSLVSYWTGEADRSLLNRRAQRALDYALRAESVLAMQLFERELAKQMEEEEMALLLTLLADD